MKKLEKYTGEKTYMFPNGKLATPEEVLQQFSAALEFVHVVETDENGEVMFAFNNLSALRSMYGIEQSLGEDEAIAAIQEKINTPEPVIEKEPSPEERIAAALEYQNLLSM
ncbi:MAG TPA: hypothetical protein H9666_04845 [Firmicutes bacterium]|nr:hypothetical protein [Bacillota bacterium]